MVSKGEVKKSIIGIIRKIFLGLCVAIFVFSAGYLINRFIIEPYKNSQLATESEADEGNTETTKLDEDKPSVQSKYLELLKTNSEFVGKLRIVAIQNESFNVTQTTDNSKYLSTDFYGRASIFGTPFVDYRNDVLSFNTNTIIYGHNTQSGDMFGDLDCYMKLENYKEYPLIQFNTIYKDYVWKVFAGFIINIYEKDDNGYVFPYLTTTFPSDAKFNEFIEDVKERSYFINDAVDIKATDKILTLSTCDHTFKDARFVLMARLVRDGENPEVDVSGARENDEQRFPQIWYDKYADGNNPYEDAEQFTIE